MTEEIRETEEVKTEQCKCFCKSEGVKKFVVVALGTFVGVYAALSLFVATHKPPVKFRHHMHRPPVEFRGAMNMPPSDFHRIKFDKRDFRKDAPVNADVPRPVK